jgi:hypothetical protein
MLQQRPLMRSLQRVFNVLPVLVLLLAGLSLPPRGASADMWCFDDPVVQVNRTTAAISVGLAGSAQQVRAAGWTATLRISVPPQAHTRVLATTQHYLTEVVQFLPTSDPQQVGALTVTFTAAHASAPTLAAVTVSSRGRTTTSTGNTQQGVQAHVSIP